MMNWLLGRKPPQLDEQLYDLQTATRTFQRMNKQAMQKSDVARRACHAAQQVNNLKDARLHASAAIRERQWALKWQDSAYKMKGVVSRLQYAVEMNSVNSTMCTITNNMMGALKDLDYDKVSKLMEQFEANFNNIDKALSATDQALDKTNAGMQDETAVDDLMNEVSDEVGMDTGERFTSAPKHSLQPVLADKETVVNVARDLEDRLHRLCQ
jgi:charged multivesicular body protein 1